MMPLILLALAALLIASALQNTQGDLAAALKADAPPFLKMAAAVVGIGAIGFVPKMEPLSRGLLGLVALVFFLTNYQRILSSFQSLAGTVAAAPASASIAPATAFAGGLPITAGEVSGTTPAGNKINAAAPVASSPFGHLPLIGTA